MSSFNSSIYFQDQNMEMYLSEMPENNNNKKNDIIEDMDENITSKFYDISNVKRIKGDNYLKIDDYPKQLIAEEFTYPEAIKLVSNNIYNTKNGLDKCDLTNIQKYEVYEVQNIEKLVEQTYQYEYNFKEQMIEECAYLEKIIYSWRQIDGDGNCYYRSVMFSWLEYLIFNQKINVIKIIISNLYVKFNDKYIYTKRLPIDIQKEFTSLEEIKISIIILYLIIDSLTDNSINESERIKNAYTILIKAFNFTISFDKIMILYIKYHLYEFIFENKDKIYSKNFEVLLGDLLPNKYIKENDEYDFDGYFNEDLLKYYTFAEKLAIYITPYILKMNITIIFYDFGNDTVILRKFFSSNLNNKESLYFLFRKAHYDICYTKEYFFSYLKYFNIHKNFSSVFYVVNTNDIENYKKNIPDFKLDESYIFDRKQNLCVVNEEKKENNLKTLLEEIKNKIDNHISCILCNKLIPISDIEKFDTLLPCGCKFVVCNKECQFQFIKNIAQFIENCPIIQNDCCFKCPKCKKDFSRIDLIEFAYLVYEKFHICCLKDSLKKVLENLFNKYCMICLCELKNVKKKYRIYCKQKIVSNIIDSSIFIHFYCRACKEIKSSDCKICGIYHFKISNVKKN